MNPIKPVRVPVYWALIGIACVFLSPVLSIYASVQIANKTTEQTIARQERTRAELAEANRLETCDLFSKFIAVYEETPPPSATGKAVEQAYRDYYNGRLMCQPPK